MQKLIYSPASSAADYPEGFAREWLITGKVRQLGCTWGSLYYALLDRDPFVSALPCWLLPHPAPVVFVDSRNDVYEYFVSADFFICHTPTLNEVFRVTHKPTLRRLSFEVKAMKAQQTNHISDSREHLLFSCPRGHQWASMRFVDSFHPQEPNCPLCQLTWCNVVDHLPSSK